MVGCGNIALFRTVAWLDWSPRLGQNTPIWELLSKEISCSTIKLFSPWNIFFIRLFLANTWKKVGAHRARLREKENVFSQSSLVWGKSLRFVRARAHVRADDAKIVRSRNYLDMKDWGTDHYKSDGRDGKKQGKVTEKINCENSKDNHGLKFIKKKTMCFYSHPSLLDSFAIKQTHTVFWKSWHTGFIPQWLTCTIWRLLQLLLNQTYIWYLKLLPIDSKQMW